MEPLRDRSGEHVLLRGIVDAALELQWSRCVIAAERCSLLRSP